jgi:GT2 family glycosyltransferase
MQVSVIIVNYNVKYFLEQCLLTVQNAISAIDAEVIVVDNDSSDGSVAWLKPKFPRVQFICNNRNLGFAKANNLALKQCRGEYVLFLNPDTLVPENAIQKSLDYIQQHPQAGALGIRMIDGKGIFLAESKRSFPSPIACFCKLIGLAAIFPSSGFFNKYALGNLDQFQSAEVPVLAGACILVRKKIMDSLNGFDESYFMYGEDIDLSYRIGQLGFENHYFAETTILHFKGRSSRRESLGYVKNFYGAMLIFVRKHYRKRAAITFYFIIQPAIAFRAILAVARRLLIPFSQPEQGSMFSKEMNVKDFVFCESEELPMSVILNQVQLQAGRNRKFFFKMKGSRSIVGSNGSYLKERNCIL